MDIFSKFFLYNVLSSKVIPFFAYNSIIFSSNIAFSSSFKFPNIKLKNPFNLAILFAKYPCSSSSMLSSLISNTFMYVFELGPIFNKVPSKLLHKFPYSIYLQKLMNYYKY